MTCNEKKDIIYKFIGDNFNNYFLYFLKTKYKYKYSDEYKREVISDIVYSILNKLTSSFYINKFYNILINNQLNNYIERSIIINCQFNTTPLHHQKLLNKWNFVAFENEILNNNNESNNTQQKSSLKIGNKDITEEEILIFIDSLFEYPKCKQIFGIHHEYLIKIFKEYFYTEVTYSKISEKYKIPYSNLYSHIKFVKDTIRKEVQNKFK